MATKRCISKDIVRTDKFLDMSLTTQALYFHLNLDADIRGFVFPKSIMRLIGSSLDDLNVLIAKGFVIPFESGVIVIKDWNVHNNLRETHEAKSQFEDLYSQLLLTDTGNYQLQENYSSTTGELLRKLSKDKLSKVKLSQVKLSQEDAIRNFKEESSHVLNLFNKLFNKNLKSTPWLNNYMFWRKTYSLEEILEAITLWHDHGWIWDGVKDPDLELFFRTKNKNGDCDYISRLLNRGGKTKTVSGLDRKEQINYYIRKMKEEGGISLEDAEKLEKLEMEELNAQSNSRY